ncbi:MAG: hypothetical protein NT005_11585 [Spirochaetes bacterium]|nr:hypothetical protein [Spirochaetota bacterium]MCX7039759.1 hypothetical protein [Spirochaetota bacterium]
MSQITLRKLPRDLEKMVRTQARLRRLSLNKTIIALLQKSLGIADDSQKGQGLAALAGTWSAAEAEEFDRNTAFFEEIDRGVWES